MRVGAVKAAAIRAGFIGQGPCVWQGLKVVFWEPGTLFSQLDVPPRGVEGWLASGLETALDAARPQAEQALVWGWCLESKTQCPVRGEPQGDTYEPPSPQGDTYESSFPHAPRWLPVHFCSWKCSTVFPTKVCSAILLLAEPPPVLKGGKRFAQHFKPWF